MYRLILIFTFFSLVLNAQDKLFFKDGTSKKGYLLSIAKDYVYFKASDTSATQKINKSKLALIEDYKGTRYLFSEHDSGIDTLKIRKSVNETPRNIVSIQPIGVFFGRATVAYERLSKDGKIGLVIPFSLTFDPFGTLYRSDLDTNANSIERIKGVKYITGADLNFYIGRKESFKFFVGPRFRYGTDLFLRNIEGYTLQTQMGWMIGSPSGGYVQHLSVGFGFVRVITAPGGVLVDPKQSYGWFSLNYRMGFKW